MAERDIRDTVACLPVDVFSGSAAPGVGDRVSEVAGCAERTMRRSPAVTTTQPTLLPQPWTSCVNPRVR
jgi:hypothetical protein